MALAKLTASGEVQVSRPRARPQVYVTWLALLADADGQAINGATDHLSDKRDYPSFALNHLSWQ